MLLTEQPIKSLSLLTVLLLSNLRRILHPDLEMKKVIPLSPYEGVGGNCHLRDGTLYHRYVRGLKLGHLRPDGDVEAVV